MMRERMRERGREALRRGSSVLLRNYFVNIVLCSLVCVASIRSEGAHLRHEVFIGGQVE